jgi:glycosyltransferase involved in cell wall biosynthesis
MSAQSLPDRQTVRNPGYLSYDTADFIRLCANVSLRFQTSFSYRIRTMNAITGTIITFNEEDRIAEAIASLACCDEVIVVDSGSTDRTCEIAAARGARVIFRAWEGYSKQKNFAAQSASNDWILSLDGDERVSVELSGEILRWKNANPDAAGFSMPRRVFYLGQWIGHSGWYPDRKIRLYHRRRAQWEGDFVHESMKVDGRVDPFQGDLLHFPYRNLQDHLSRIDRYTQLASEAARKDGRRSNPVKLVVGPFAAFLGSFVAHAGFLDGWRGLVIACMGARYVFKRELRILR